MQRTLWFAKLVLIGCAVAVVFFIALTFITQLGQDLNCMNGLGC